MVSILILGAGRSSSSLISYLLDNAGALDASITVGDAMITLAKERTGGRGKAIEFDITNKEISRESIHDADVVISMIPAHLHSQVASLCLEEGKHLLTASYVSEEMKAFDPAAKEKNLLFLNECGLDPGIDHMSAMKLIDDIKGQGGRLLSFESFTGGLIAPETDPGNPWGYKFTWNPRNVVMAGQGVAKFLQEGQFKYIPYGQLFKRVTEISVSGNGNYEGYVNRDSLKYIDTYGLQGIHTMIRGTLRNKGFCPAWNALVQLGCTDDSYTLESVAEMTHRDFINSFLNFDGHKNVEEKLCFNLHLDIQGEEMKRLRWSGFFDKERIGLTKGTPAQVLEHILNKKWKLNPNDKDLVVMWHRFVYEHGGKKREIQSSLVAKGDDGTHTAMAKTVGLPLAIAAKLLIQGKIKSRGVVIPTVKEIYEPVLKEIRMLGIDFVEKEV